MGTIRLVPIQVSDETVSALEHLLEEARAGRIIGIAWVSMHSAYHYDADIAGETRRSLTFTRGMLRVLDDALGRLIAEEEPHHSA